MPLRLSMAGLYTTLGQDGIRLSAKLKFGQKDRRSQLDD